MYGLKKIALSVLLVAAIFSAKAQDKIICIIKTELGDITLEVYPKKAPLTVANFMNYVDARLYDSSSFFRAVRLDNQRGNNIKIEVIQGGDVDSTKEYAPIALETTQQTGLYHNDGTISMARSGPATATSSFFICINDQHSLDFGGKRNPDGQGFAAFGQVTHGMDIVKKIQELYPKQGQYFKPVVRIISIRRA